MSDVGKIVVCTTLQGNKFITVGTAYEVEQEAYFHYTVKNDKGVSTRYSKDCFEKQPKKAEKQKLKVACINTGQHIHLTVGKTYEVICDDDTHYQIVNDNGLHYYYKKEYFKLGEAEVETPVKPPIGLIPRNIYWEELNQHRRQDIIAAMQRRIEAKMDIPIEWCQELIDLVIAGDKNE